LVPTSARRIDAVSQTVRACQQCTGPECTDPAFNPDPRLNYLDCGATLESRHEIDPEWSPDGSRLAYLADYQEFTLPSGRTMNGSREVFVAEPNGSAHRIAALPDGGAIFRGIEWSPGGDWLLLSITATVEDESAPTDLYVVDAFGPDDQVPRPVTRGVVVENRFTWRGSVLVLPAVQP